MTVRKARAPVQRTPTANLQEVRSRESHTVVSHDWVKVADEIDVIVPGAYDVELEIEIQKDSLDETSEFRLRLRNGETIYRDSFAACVHMTDRPARFSVDGRKIEMRPGDHVVLEATCGLRHHSIRVVRSMIRIIEDKGLG